MMPPRWNGFLKQVGIDKGDAGLNRRIIRHRAGKNKRWRGHGRRRNNAVGIAQNARISLA
jgi:hypothetical protein